MSTDPSKNLSPQKSTFSPLKVQTAMRWSEVAPFSLVPALPMGKCRQYTGCWLPPFPRLLVTWLCKWPKESGSRSKEGQGCVRPPTETRMAGFIYQQHTPNQAVANGNCKNAGRMNAAGLCCHQLAKLLLCGQRLEGVVTACLLGEVG